MKSYLHNTSKTTGCLNTLSRGRLAAVCVLMVFILTGCAAWPTAKRLPPPEAGAIFNPAGTWFYQERGHVLALELDSHGNGHYEWQNGSFRTEQIAGLHWTGTWHQRGNDREGGFEIELDAGHRNGKGRWWYTRIGADTKPARPGGKFTIRR